MQCFYHPERGAVGLCRNCGKAVCRDCVEDVGGSLLCVGCQEIARNEQQAAEQEDQAARDRIAARAALKLRIAQYVFWGTVIFGVVLGVAQIIGFATGSLQDPRFSSPGGIISFLVALPFGILIAAYVMWAFYWGEIAAWRFWINLFRRTGWFVHASLVGWVTLLLIFITCPYMLGIFYGVFGGGIVEYRRTKRLAGSGGGATPSFRWIVQRPWRTVFLVILIVGSIVVVSRLEQRQQETPKQAIEAPTSAPQSATASSDPTAVSQVGAQPAPANNSFLEPITDSGIATQAPQGSSVYEAEQASLNGAARLCTDHSGFSGTAFVCGYGPEGAGNSTTTFQVQVPSAGAFLVSLRYANANSQAMTLSVYVNGVKARVTVLQPLSTWDSWSEQDEVLTLVSGTNEISYRYDLSDSGHVNLDQIRIRPR